ncbi:MAG: hypothetical protein WC527_04290 [Candidatus Margulisiibacteriota bacterium]
MIKSIALDKRAINQAISSCHLRPCADRDVVGVRRSINRLWGPFTSKVHEELLAGRKCSLSVTKEQSAALFLGVDDQMIGPIHDPLGIAASMAKRNLEQISFAPYVLPSKIEKIMLVILTRGFQEIEVGKRRVYCLDDLFVDEVCRGLPVTLGVTYKFVSRAIIAADKDGPFDKTLKAFRDQVRINTSADSIIKAAGQIVAACPDDVRNILSAKAGDFAEAKYSVTQRDIASAVKIWEYILSISPSCKRKYNLVRTMVRMARRIYPVDGTRDGKNLDDALKIWDCAHKIASSDDDLRGEVENIYRDMASLARKLTSLTPGKNRKDPDAALKIWKMACFWSDEAANLVGTAAQFINTSE